MIRSEPLTNSAPRQTSSRPVAIPLTAVLLGMALWLIGARYTIDGVLWLTNALLRFLRLPVALPAVSWQLATLLIWLPYLCSRVEWQPPVYRQQGHWRFGTMYNLVVWLIVASLDTLTTYFGVRTPDPHGWPAMQQVAQSIILSGLLAVVLTFMPEWLLRIGWGQLTKKRGSHEQRTHP